MLLALGFRADTGARDMPRGQAGSQHTQDRHRHIEIQQSGGDGRGVQTLLVATAAFIAKSEGKLGK